MARGRPGPPRAERVVPGSLRGDAPDCAPKASGYRNALRKIKSAEVSVRYVRRVVTTCTGSP